jgi:hypothetical protein
MILSSHGIIASQIASFDADASAFFGRVSAAGGTLSLTEKNAVNTLVIQMKADGTWTPMKAIYPMVGASAAACAQNLKSSSFTGTFTSGWTFASTGVTPNGISAYMDTALNTLTNLTTTTAHLSIYVRNNSSIVNPYDLANSTNLGLTVDSTFLISRYSTNTAYFGMADTTYGTSVSSTDSRGLWLGATNGSRAQILYKNGTSVATGTGSGSFANNNLYLGAANGGGVASLFSSKQYAFCTIGNGLSGTQQGNFYTAVQAFQTTLSRNV